MSEMRKLNLSDEDINLVLTALGEMKYRVSAGVVSRIVKQLTQKQAAPPGKLTVLPGEATK